MEYGHVCGYYWQVQWDLCEYVAADQGQVEECHNQALWHVDRYRDATGRCYGAWEVVWMLQASERKKWFVTSCQISH